MEYLSLNNLPKMPHVEAILDNIRSAWNVGSIFRTADGVGIKKIYLCGITPAPTNPKVVKTALGAEQNVLWEKHNNCIILSNQLKQKGYRLWVLEDTPEAQPLFQYERSDEVTPIVFVVGNEIAGVDPGIIEISDKVLAIPMQGKKQSYNVSVAFGIAVSFLIYRQIFSHGSRKMFPST
jgi:23S rRNA (guanosine2251-2'-O)-methyltransferase